MERTIEMKINIISRMAKGQPLVGHTLKCRFLLMAPASVDMVIDPRVQMQFMKMVIDTISNKIFLSDKDSLIKTFKKRNMPVIVLNLASLENIAKYIMSTMMPLAVTVDDHMGNEVTVTTLDVKKPSEDVDEDNEDNEDKSMSPDLKTDKE